MKTQIYTFYEQIIIDSIQLNELGLNNETPLFEQIQAVYEHFKSEYKTKKNNSLEEPIYFAKWLMGCPIVIDIPFMDEDILKIAKDYGMIIKDEKKFIDHYYMHISNAFFTLKNNL